MATPNLNFTLYPPIVDTYMPAFLSDDACTVYFSLSSYNSLEDIQGLQFTVKRQDKNTTALKNGLSMITLSSDAIQTTFTELGDAQYSFKIHKNLMHGEVFEINTYYKVQVRFIDSQTALPTENQNIEIWNKEHLSNLSEWSTACLIRGILRPDIYLQNFDTEKDTAIASGKETYISAPQVLDVVGRMFFNDTSKRMEGENLKSYRVRIWDADNVAVGQELDDSGIIYVDQFSNENGINYSIKYNFASEQSYVLIIECETNNLYTFNKRYNFKIKKSILEAFKGKLSLEVDNEAGAVKLNFTTDESYFGNITIRRTSSETGFQVWEDVNTTVADLKTISSSITINDYTIKSGVFYKYAIQKRSSNGLRGDLLIATKEIEQKDEHGMPLVDEDGNIITKIVEDMVMVVFDDIFLTRQNKQLRIEFDPQISSFGYQVAEAKTDTIGSQFPFVRRNGKLKYREFPISGQITHISNIYNFLNDEEHKREDSCGTIEKGYFEQKSLLVDKKKYYNQYKNLGQSEPYNIAKLYEDYEFEHNITDYNNYIWERDFREAVMDFLYEDSVKLFRSTTEGNILVKLTGISFTPNQQLGRLIYNFSATATEIAEPSFDNYKNYGVVSSGAISNVISSLQNELVSLTLDLKKSTPLAEEKIEWDLDSRPYDIISAINKYINREVIAGDYTTYTIHKLKWLRLQFKTPPHRIAFSQSGDPIIVTSNVEPEKSAPTTSALAYGYVVTINGTNRFVNKNGYYEVTDEENLDISSLTFPIDEVVDVECHIVKSQGENTERMESISYTYEKVAQIDKNIATNYDFIQDIKEKYNILDADFVQTVQSISTLDIEAPVGSIFYIQSTGSDEHTRHVIGKTGRLRLSDDKYNFTSAIYGGVMLFKADSPQIEDGEYFDSGKTLSQDNQTYSYKENQLYSTGGVENYYITVYNPNLSVTNKILIKKENTLVEKSIGYSLIMESPNQENFIAYQNSLYPVDLDNIGYDTIQFKPSIDVLVTFRCSITGEEG